MNFFRFVRLFSIKMSKIGPNETKINECLTKALNPLHLEIKNESYMHNVPKGNLFMN